MLVYLKGKKKSLYLDHYSICRWQVFIVNSHKPSRGAESNNFSESSKYT